MSAPPAAAAMPAPAPGCQPGCRPGYRPDIDGLRGLAVLLVLLYHAFPALAPGGFTGVDVFFVVSGLLIGGLVLDALESPAGFSFVAFHARRIRRIFPALILVLAACYAYGWLRIAPAQLAAFCRHIAAGAGFVTNLLLMSEAGYFDAASNTKPLLHLWSLGVEEQFYLLLPAALWAAHRLRANAAALAAALLAASLGLCLATADAVTAFYAPWTRLWELFLGVLLAALARQRPGWLGSLLVRLDSLLAALPGLAARAAGGVLRRDLSALAGAGLILGGALALGEDGAHPALAALPPTLGAALVLVAGPGAWLNRAVLAQRWPVRLGLVSYPLYLWHWPILVGLFPLAARLGPAQAAGLKALGLAAGLCLAAATYLLVERPVRFGPRGGRKALAAVALMALVGGVAWASHLDRGLVFRFAPEVRAMVGYTYDWGTDYRTRVCLLWRDQDERDFGDCATGNPEGRRVLLWGDSYAAHLAVGLDAATGARHRLTQRALASCPPLVGVRPESSPACQRVNDFVTRQILEDPPWRVILASFWREGQLDGPDAERLAATIRALRAAGVAEVVLVGPQPHFEDAPQTLLARAAMQGRYPAHPASFPVAAAWFELDAKLAALAGREGARYVSPLSLFCADGQCLATLGPRPEDLLFWDNGHLTRTGSVYLARIMPE